MKTNILQGALWLPFFFLPLFCGAQLSPTLSLVNETITVDKAFMVLRKNHQLFHIQIERQDKKLRFRISEKGSTKAGAQGTLQINAEGKRELQLTLKEKGFLDLMLYAIDRTYIEEQQLRMFDGKQIDLFSRCIKVCQTYPALLEMIEEDNNPLVVFHAGRTNDGYIPCSLKAMLVYNQCVQACEQILD